MKRRVLIGITLLVVLAAVVWFAEHPDAKQAEETPASLTKNNPTYRSMADSGRESQAPLNSTRNAVPGSDAEQALASKNCRIIRALQNTELEQTALNVYKDLSLLFELSGDPQPMALARYIEQQLRTEQYASLYINEQEFIGRHAYHDYDQRVLLSLSEQGDGMASLMLARNMLKPWRDDPTIPIPSADYRQSVELLYKAVQQGRREALTMLLELRLIPTKSLPVVQTELNEEGYHEEQLIELHALRKIIDEHGTLQSFLMSRDHENNLLPSSADAANLLDQRYQELREQFKLPPLSNLDQRARENFSIIFNAIRMEQDHSACVQSP